MKEYLVIPAFVFFTFVGVILPCYALETGQSSLLSAADFVWVKPGRTSSSLLHSRFLDDQWSDPEVLVESRTGLVNTPSVVRTDKGALWVFWSVLQGDDSQLFSMHQTEGRWSAPSTIPSKMHFNSGSVVTLAADGLPWIFWVGNDSGDDDIYSARWQGNEWSRPVRVNEENSAPDILPFCGLDGKGRVWVAWLGFNGQRYQRYFSFWAGDHWSAQAPFTDDNPLFAMAERRFRIRPSLPAAAGNRASGYLDIQDGNRYIRSFRMLFKGPTQ